MTSTDLVHDHRRAWLAARAALTVLVTAVAAAGCAYATVLAAFVFTPTCTSAQEPWPFKVGLVVGIALCGVLPLAVAGRRLRVLGGVLAVLSAGGLLVTFHSLLVEPVSGFCF